jgi:hypothetical protein
MPMEGVTCMIGLSWPWRRLLVGEVGASQTSGLLWMWLCRMVPRLVLQEVRLKSKYD